MSLLTGNQRFFTAQQRGIFKLNGSVFIMGNIKNVNGLLSKIKFSHIDTL